MAKAKKKDSGEQKAPEFRGKTQSPGEVKRELLVKNGIQPDIAEWLCKSDREVLVYYEMVLTKETWDKATRTYTVPELSFDVDRILPAMLPADKHAQIWKSPPEQADKRALQWTVQLSEWEYEQAKALRGEEKPPNRIGIIEWIDIASTLFIRLKHIVVPHEQAEQIIQELAEQTKCEYAILKIDGA